MSDEEKRRDTKSGVTLHSERKVEEAEKNAAVWDSKGQGSGYESPILPRVRKHGGNLKIWRPPFWVERVYGEQHLAPVTHIS